VPALLGSMLRRRTCVLLAGTSCAIFGAAALAQAPEPKLAQLAHRAWTARDGAPGGILALAQTRDGYLWLGGATGLFRFDGVRFERYVPPPGLALPSNGVDALLATDDGALWVGYQLGGASVIRGDTGLVSYGPRDGLPAGAVNAFARDSDGGIWVATTRGVARKSGERWHAIGTEMGFQGGFTTDLTVDQRGALWVCAATGVYVLRRGAQRFSLRAPALAVGPELGSGGVRPAPDGSVWSAAPSGGLTQLTDTIGRAVAAVPYYDRDRGVNRGGWIGLMIDRHATAWGTFTGGKLVRVALPDGNRAPARRPIRDTLAFSPKSGTSGSFIYTVFEDREGTTWVTSEGGVDQFRSPKFMASEWPDDLTGPPSMAPADDGALWVGGTSRSLTLLNDSSRTRIGTFTGSDLLHRDIDGELWVGSISGLRQWTNGSFAQVALPPELRGCYLWAIAHAADGTLWVSGPRCGTFRRRGTSWERYGARDTYAKVIVADSAGHVWLGNTGDRRLIREGGGPRRVYGAADGLDVGHILSLSVHGGRLLVGGELGAAVMDLSETFGGERTEQQSRITSLVPSDGPLLTVNGVVLTGGALWLRNADGVARIPLREVERAARDTNYHVRVERFDARDRVEGPTSFLGPGAVVGSDGRLWVSWTGGLGWIDPAHIRRNRVPPPVTVRQLAAGGQSYRSSERITLPKATRALSISYTALSLAVPERVRFRYRLVGLDTSWVDAGTRREAFFTNLGPGPYRFEVTAANDDGMWSVRPAMLDFSIPPTFVQTAAFQGLCALAAGGALWLIFAYRQRRVAEAMRARFDAVLAERTRVARELHDTLLSDVAGIRMRLDAVARTTDETQVGATIAEIRDQASVALANARRAVVEMRSADTARTIDEQLADAARRIFADSFTVAHVSRTGPPRRYSSDVEAEALRVASEAMTNARSHAACRTVHVTCTYGAQSLRVEVRDDGHGFDPVHVDANGHFGLVGMRERAATLGATFAIESAPGRGTTVLLTIPVAPDY